MSCSACTPMHACLTTVCVPTRRLVGLLQLLALVMFCIAWPVIMDFMVFLFDCKWSNLSRGWPATHVYFTEQSGCLLCLLPFQQSDACIPSHRLKVLLLLLLRSAPQSCAFVSCCRLHGDAAPGAHVVCWGHDPHPGCRRLADGELRCGRQDVLGLLESRQCSSPAATAAW